MSDRPSDGLLVIETEVVRDDAVVVRLAGEVDISSADLLTDQFKAISGQDKQAVILDASAVTFMDSTGLHALVEGKRLLHDHGTRIFLVPSQQVRRVLELVFPDQLFAARVSSVDEALAEMDTNVTDTAAG